MNLKMHMSTLLQYPSPRAEISPSDGKSCWWRSLQSHFDAQVSVRTINDSNSKK